jgi:hypothetical protein
MHKPLCAVLLLAAGWHGAFAASAQSPPLQPAGLATLVPEIVIAVADPAGFDGKAVEADQLATLRGGADTVTNTMRLDGAVSGNSAVNVLSGANSIGNGSFSNASGLPIAIQNSGANVLIQNATIINIQMQ